MTTSDRTLTESQRGGGRDGTACGGRATHQAVDTRRWRPARASASAIERRTNGNDELHELLTVDEVAALLKVSRSWVYEHTRARRLRRGERLPQIKIGKYVRFDARAVRAFLEKKCHVT